MNPLIQLKITTTFLIALALFGFAMLPKAQAIVPPPDGGYPGFNTAEGQNALFSLTTATGNVGVGWASLYSDAEGNFNTAIGTGALLFNTAEQNTGTGAGALLSNTIGFNNTANGAFALLNNTEGSLNTATGTSALFNNTTGSFNTANGEAALFRNTTGGSNTANGFQALGQNTIGHHNTASGYQALLGNTEGVDNTANGASALFSNTTGSNNTADGFEALANTTGSNNTAAGDRALALNTAGEGNTATGVNALFSNTTGNNNTAIGGGALFHNTTGSVNVAVGDFAGGNLTTGDVNIDILNPGVAGESNTIRIGVTQTRTFIAGIFGTNVSGSTVVVNSDGQLGVAASSRRFKREIKPMDKASEAVFALKPVAFRYKKEIDPALTSQFGLVAEEVEKVNPDLIVRDKEGKPYSVRYDQVNAMLLNEFLKEHKTVQKQGATIARLEKQIDALSTGLQKVSAQLEVSKPAPGTVKNND
jgi:hypothetical protein